MKTDTADTRGLSGILDLERRILAVLSILEGGRRLEDLGEYVLPDGRRVRANLEGVRLLLKDGATIEAQTMDAAVARLLEEGLVTRSADCYFLSATGKRLGRKCRSERMSKGYDDLLTRTEASKAYSVFCERVFGKDLSQFNVLDMTQLNALITDLSLKPGEMVLDLGCGNGKIAEYISDLTSARIVGVDFAASVIAGAQRRTVNKQDRLTYVVGDIDELALEPERFDAIISIDTMYFVDSIDATIRELKRLLKPTTGRLAIFYDQTCGLEESRDALLPKNTKVGAALRNNGMTYETVDYTDNSRQIWIREIAAAESLKEQFAAEGNTDICEDRAQDAKRTLETIESGRHERYFYLARPT
jgi:ubiquinone/menaquinone biosynthesis C-methylase UbiE